MAFSEHGSEHCMLCMFKNPNALVGRVLKDGKSQKMVCTASRVEYFQNKTKPVLERPSLKEKRTRSELTINQSRQLDLHWGPWPSPALHCGGIPIIKFWNDYNEEKNTKHVYTNSESGEKASGKKCRCINCWEIVLSTQAAPYTNRLFLSCT